MRVAPESSTYKKICSRMKIKADSNQTDRENTSERSQNPRVKRRSACDHALGRMARRMIRRTRVWSRGPMRDHMVLGHSHVPQRVITLSERVVTRPERMVTRPKRMVTRPEGQK